MGKKISLEQPFKKPSIHLYPDYGEFDIEAYSDIQKIEAGFIEFYGINAETKSFEHIVFSGDYAIIEVEKY